jgi:hypothetical protein
MAVFGKKNSKDANQPLAKYAVVYRGGHPDLPKPKSGGIDLLLEADGFQLTPTIGSKGYWPPTHIRYEDVLDVQITERQVSTFESVLAGMDSRQLNQANNLHFTFADGAGNPTTLRFEMLTGVTVMGQAKKCREFEDRLGTLGIRPRFRAVTPSDGSAPAAGANIGDLIAKLASLRDQGILTDEQFEAKKIELLGRL